MPSATRQLPLSPAELAELTRALGERSIDYAVGMLAGVVSVPQVLPSQLWIGELMSNARLQDIQQAERLAELIMRINNHVAQSLMGGEPELVCPDPDNDRACFDFIDGYLDICQRAEVDSAFDDETGQAFGMLVAYTRVPDAVLKRDLKPGANIADFKANIGRMLPSIIGLLHTTWLAQRRPPSVAQREGAKEGRNDLCSCGSGRKYKRCCGANA